MITETPVRAPGKFNPWLDIWFVPRETMRTILKRGSGNGFLWIAFAFGAVQALEYASREHLGDSLGLVKILGGAFLLGPLAGLLILAILPRFVGAWARFFGGKADLDTTTTAVAWAQAPALVALGLWLVQLLIFQDEMFASYTPRLESNPALHFLRTPFVALQRIILPLVQLTLAFTTVAEVNRFSVIQAVFSFGCAGITLAGLFLCGAIALLFML